MLLVTCLLESNLCSTDMYLPFDGIINSICFQMEHPELCYTQIMDTPIVVDLPIKKNNVTKDIYYYNCSFALYDKKKDTEYIYYWHKRFDVQYSDICDFKGKKEKVDIKSGMYKAYRMPIICHTVRELKWYVEGDKDRIEFYLRFIKNIGKKGAQGFGLVKLWMVEEINENIDISLYRPIPVTEQGLKQRLEKESTQLHFMGYRPPYWHKDNQGLCMYKERNEYERNTKKN